MIQLVLLGSPMPLLYVFCISLDEIMFVIGVLLLCLLLGLFPCEPYMTFFAKKRLEVVAWYNFLIVLDELVISLKGILLTLSIHSALFVIAVSFSEARIGCGRDVFNTGWTA